MDLIDLMEKQSIVFLEKHLKENYSSEEISLLLDMFGCSDLEVLCFFHWINTFYYLMPLTEAPLYINHKDDSISKVFVWRLTCGK